jgi:uncharacterized protein (DUF1800 family)
LLFLILTIGSAGCGAPFAPSIAIGGPSTIRVGGSATYTPTIVGLSNPAVFWSVVSSTGAPAASISSAGVLAAPPDTGQPASGTLTVTATSAAQPSLTASMQVQLLNPAVQIASASVAAGAANAYTLSISGSGFLPASTVTAGSASYTPSSASPTQLIVQLPLSALQAAQLSVSVVDPAPGANSSNTVTAVVPQSLASSCPGTAVLGGTALCTFQATGFSNPQVVWSVSPPSGTSANGQLGAISQNGTYSAPPPGTSIIAVTVTATSVAAPTLSSTAQIQLLNPAPVISAATIAPGASVDYLIDVQGQGFAPNSTLQLGERAIIPAYISPNELTADILQPVLPGPTVSLSVATPNAEAQNSNALTVPVPQVTPSATAAARLLDQATFGPTLADIAHVQAVGISQFLQDQFDTPALVIPPEPHLWNDFGPPCAPFFSCLSQGVWFADVMTGNDQLRERMAYALGQIWVVSIDYEDPRFLPYYKNLLAADAFGNWRQLMTDMTLSPAMGTMLNMVNNLTTSQNPKPNENFARENLQLFNLGLYSLNDDGSVATDSLGNPIAAYTQDQVTAFARVFTGWSYANYDCSTPTSPVPTSWASGNDIWVGTSCPMVPFDAYHDTGQKALLDGTVLPAGQGAAQDLSEALDNIFANSSLPPFVCRQLIQKLVESSPSPAYVNRCVQTFKNDGSGTRGNLQAVAAEILTDAEARAGDLVGTPGFSSDISNAGHLREPVLWWLSVLRGIGAQQTGTARDLSNVFYTLLTGTEEPLDSAPSVFGFFSPGYVLPQSTYNAPEFQIESTSTILTNLQNSRYYLIDNLLDGYTYDFSDAGPLGVLAGRDPGLLLDQLNVLFMHGAMPSAMRTAILQQISGETPGNQVKDAIFLTISSPQYRILQ